MTKLLIAFFFIIFSITDAIGQIGVRFSYSDIKSSTWEVGTRRILDQTNQYLKTYRIGIDFRKRLKSPRIEFYPTLWVAGSNKLEFGVRIDPSQDLALYSLQYFNVSLALNTHIYLFDLQGDCDCPTWGKEGGLFKKGFFFHIAPEIGSRMVNGSNTYINDETTKFSFLYGFSGGLGLDIGITEQITLTPMFRMGYYGPTSLPMDVEVISGKGDDKTIYYGPEVRLGMEF